MEQKKEGSVQKMQTVFDQIAAFAGYGFNKSHAAAYALILQTAWIKQIIYMSFCFHDDCKNNNTEKLSLFIDDAKKLGLKVLQPCINK